MIEKNRSGVDIYGCHNVIRIRPGGAGQVYMDVEHSEAGVGLGNKQHTS